MFEMPSKHCCMRNLETFKNIGFTIFGDNNRKFTCLCAPYYCILGNIDQYRMTHVSLMPDQLVQHFLNIEITCYVFVDSAF